MTNIPQQFVRLIVIIRPLAPNSLSAADWDAVGEVVDHGGVVDGGLLLMRRVVYALRYSWSKVVGLFVSGEGSVNMLPIEASNGQQMYQYCGASQLILRRGVLVQA